MGCAEGRVKAWFVQSCNITRAIQAAHAHYRWRLEIALQIDSTKRSPTGRQRRAISQEKHLQSWHEHMSARMWDCKLNNVDTRAPRLLKPRHGTALMKGWNTSRKVS
jgi:hypothetical protein